jgi:hypothetical protein
MAGLVPAISIRRRRALLIGMRGTSPRMTTESGERAVIRTSEFDNHPTTSPAFCRAIAISARAARAMSPLSLPMVTKRKPMPTMRAA